MTSVRRWPRDLWILKRNTDSVSGSWNFSQSSENHIRHIEAALKIHKMCGDKDYIKYIARLMDIAELPYDYMYKYPASLGGGEKQMVAIARALATDPSHSPRRAYQRLDVSVQAKIINTLIKLQKEMSLSYLFITHDLSLMRNVADRGHNVSGTNSRNCADGKLFQKSAALTPRCSSRLYL